MTSDGRARARPFSFGRRCEPLARASQSADATCRACHELAACPLSLTSLRTERWPIAGTFTISRGAKTEAAVVVAELSDGRHRGRGECVPYARYGETVDGVIARDRGDGGAAGARARPRGAAAGDAAGRRAQRARLRVLGSGSQAQPAGRFMSSPACPRRSRWSPPTRFRSARPSAMAAAAAQPRRPRAAQDQARRRRRSERGSRRCGAAAPTRELIVDANEGWTADNLADNLAACADGRRHAGRTAAAGRRRCRARPRSRGRSRSAPTKACTTARSLAALRRHATTPSTSSSTRPAA